MSKSVYIKAEFSGIFVRLSDGWSGTLKTHLEQSFGDELFKAVVVNGNALTTQVSLN